MRGEPIVAVNYNLKVLINSLQADLAVYKRICMSVVSACAETRISIPFAPLTTINIADISVSGSSPTYLGSALDFVIKKAQEASIFNPGQLCRPSLIVITDGKVTDIQKFRAVAATIRSSPFAAVVGLLTGVKTDTTYLELICGRIEKLDTCDSGTFRDIFSQILEQSTAIDPVTQHGMQDPPPEIDIV